MLDGVVPPVRGGDAVVPVEPVAAPVVPPLMSAEGDACVVSVRLRAPRLRAPRDGRGDIPPVIEPEPVEPALIEPALIEPAPMLPDAPLMEPDDMLLLSVIRLRVVRCPGRPTDELWLIVDTLMVSPFVLATRV